MTTLERIPSGVAAPTTTVSDVLSLAREAGVLIVDLRFVDLPGQAQHFSIPVKDLGEDLFIDGIGFDGSSIRGFQHIHESDMLLMPDPTTAYVDPTLEIPTLILSCDVVEPGSREPYSRDPRYIARKAERYLTESGIATTSFWGPEVEFYIFATGRRTSLTGRDPRRATSRSRRWTHSRTCAAEWCSRSRRPGSTSRSSITKSVDPGSRRSTSATGRSSRPLTASFATSTS